LSHYTKVILKNKRTGKPLGPSGVRKRLTKAMREMDLSFWPKNHVVVGHPGKKQYSYSRSFEVTAEEADGFGVVTATFAFSHALLEPDSLRKLDKVLLDGLRRYYGPDADVEISG
jgi:hypothetical protein